MSARQSPMGRPSAAPDEAVRRYVEALRADREPDPLFRRRLRGVVTNRFVVGREKPVQPAGVEFAMGRLGRACLYASVALAVSVGGTLAASRGSVPGDLLYPVKLQIEALRMGTLPAEFHDELALYALSERVRELGVLAEAGEWDALSSAAAAVEAAHADLERLKAPGADEAALGRRVEVLESLLARLPEEARSAIQHVLGDTGLREPRVGAQNRGADPGTDDPHEPTTQADEPQRGGEVGAPATLPGAEQGGVHDASRTEPTQPSPSARPTASAMRPASSRPEPPKASSPQANEAVLPRDMRTNVQPSDVHGD